MYVDPSHKNRIRGMRPARTEAERREMTSPKSGPETRKTKRCAVELEIKLNNAATNDPCALCGRRTDPECGPELFLGGTWELVCYECGAEHTPDLVECLKAYRFDFPAQPVRQSLSEQQQGEELEREMSGNLTPTDEGIVDLRVERLRRRDTEEWCVFDHPRDR
jgi:hypothetical protein